jgi:hypothetical protein
MNHCQKTILYADKLQNLNEMIDLKTIHCRQTLEPEYIIHDLSPGRGGLFVEANQHLNRAP